MYKLVLLSALAAIGNSCKDATSVKDNRTDNSAVIDSVNSVYQQIVNAANEADADKVVSFFSRYTDLYIVAGNTTVLRILTLSMRY